MDENQNFMSENGQSLIIIALIMLALLAMLALVLDGGNTYFQRRNAQNAADAAALAGANAYCEEDDPALAYNAGLSAATNYANLNDFNLANFSVVVTPTARIDVTTRDTYALSEPPAFPRKSADRPGGWIWRRVDWPTGERHRAHRGA